QIVFVPKRDMVFNGDKALPLHPNGMQLSALDENDRLLLKSIYYSIGGGEIISENTPATTSDPHVLQNQSAYPFTSAAQLTELCKKNGCTIADLMLQHELQYKTKQQIEEGILEIAQAMNSCIDNGCHSAAGTLPGGLFVRRRAPVLFKQLVSSKINNPSDPLNYVQALQKLNVYAMAVNEENADCKRVVTAPTNGASGTIPAVMRFMQEMYGKNTQEDYCTFFLTAAAIGLLFKQNVSLSGAAMGCQGEVGVACSMAAAALTAVLGGNSKQILNAAEIGMEHNLGLTCDPPKGLVQIPCIERNAMGALKAVNASILALSRKDGARVSLDTVIKAMREIGEKMDPAFRETAQGGLAKFFGKSVKDSHSKEKSCRDSACGNTNPRFPQC
ncbi:MAG: L-serine ammonia-lyase, partial [Legionellales bacterium RIFCSPHIGHO2_12_FULL_42_9]